MKETVLLVINLTGSTSTYSKILVVPNNAKRVVIKQAHYREATTLGDTYFLRSDMSTENNGFLCHFDADKLHESVSSGLDYRLTNNSGRYNFTIHNSSLAQDATPDGVLTLFLEFQD